MKGLIAIIAVLSEEEKRDFLLHLGRKNRRTDTKNTTLFKLIDAGKTENIDVLLYGKPAKNSYHALCKRLQDSLIDFVASNSFAGETSEELETLKLLLASRIFFERKQYKIAFKTLERAENFAKLTDMYSILNEIYHTKLQYAHLNSRLIFSESIQAAEENMRLYQQDFRLNKALAVIKSELKHENHGSIYELIQTSFSEFQIKIDTALTYKSLFQLMEITATAARLQSDYYSIAPFMLQTYEIIKQKGDFKDKHRFYHISILNLLAITHFRNKKFERSIEFANKMEIEMKKGNRNLYKRFLVKLVIIKALNLNYTGKAKLAIPLLTKFKNEALDLKLLLVMCMFQQSEFALAYQNLRALYHSDVWYEKKTGKIWVIKKNIIEILLLIEMDKLDLVLGRLLSFKRRFAKFLGEIGEQRVLTFMNLVNRYYENPVAVISSDFKDEVEHSFDWLEKEQEDIFVMSFYAWLKAKMQREDIYKITLQLVGAPIN